MRAVSFLHFFPFLLTGRKRNSKFRQCEKMGGICKSQKTHGCSILPAECKSRYKHCCRL
ncbi:beta-defensin 33-like [Mus caroli]|uniref:Beta-defensin 33-like n=1 Tax=Mus caroli TaxID=10089 RepID=A0A6P5Q7K8_MUSCR|nr:beta-defensin 33-like [Mus caroli]